MPQNLPPQFILNDVSSGLVNNVKWNLTPPNSVDLMVNMVADEVFGEAVVRKGLTLLGSQIHASSNAISGLYYFADSGSGTSSHLIAVANNGTNNLLYYYNGTIWVASNTLNDTTGLKTRFETFLDYAVRVNGTDTVKTSSDGGATWGVNAALDDANFPNGKFLKVYKAQMTVAGKSSKPDSLYISSVPNAGGTAISWTSGNREIVINPSDGENITGLGEVAGLEIIFKDRSMYRWNNRSTDADTIIAVGCSSNESIVNCGAGLLAFFNPKGIWVTSGDQPILISRRVQKWIDGMSSSYYGNVASYGDGEHLYCSIGNCTVDGRTFNNVVLRYSVNTKEWCVFSYAYQFRNFALFINSGAEQIVGGDTTNRVLQLESTSLTDNGTNIGYELQTHDLDFGSRGIKKELCEKVMAYGLNISNCLIQVKVNDGDWLTLGNLEKSISTFLVNQQIKGNYLRFRAVGTSSSARLRFQGLELPKVTLLDYAD